ncbi:DUF938 domain-containing protein [Sphingomonas ginkgonis]|uniref:DUF938 domain-containing protein n=1 Tax=Sphingomonas ginkgonis TaxID=2315330 RepID=A0A429V9B1_9SPHN|nr:DUF938 domain-containing protein [Sphingomonas ginkgonis]RST30514.1 DUF938 domain-containing protein [Sphingomonas ginkgonis]
MSGAQSSPAAARNRAPIAAVLEGWLPERGTVLEIASGTGEHALFLARRFSAIEWQPSDASDAALASIAAWRTEEGLPNLRPPLRLDVRDDWPVLDAAAVLCINMVHISPWAASLALLDGSARLLASGAPLILYGPWIVDGEETAPGNLAFDADLRRRDPAWGLRRTGTFREAAEERGFAFAQMRDMPANNRMLLFRKV